MLTGCGSALDVTAESRTFDNTLRMDGHGFQITQDETAMTVTVQWSLLAQPQYQDSLIAYLHVYDADDVLIVQENITPNLPQVGTYFSVTYRIVPSATRFAEGRYAVRVGWYYNTNPSQFLIIQRDTADQKQMLELFKFSVNRAGDIVPPALLLEPNTPES